MKIILKENDEIEEYLKLKNNKETRLSEKERKYMLLGILAIIIILVIGFIVAMILEGLNHKNYLTENECYEKIMEYKEVKWYNQLFVITIPYIPLLIVGIVLGWILHGVGFRII